MLKFFAVLIWLISAFNVVCSELSIFGLITVTHPAELGIMTFISVIMSAIAAIAVNGK